MAYSRPFYKSRRLRYLTAGIAGTLLLVTGFASADTVNEEPKINLMVEQRECGDSTFVTPLPGHTEFFDQDGVLNVRVVTAGCCCCGTPDIGEGTTGRLIRPGGATTQSTHIPGTSSVRSERPAEQTETPEVLPAREERALSRIPGAPPIASGGLAGVSAEPVVRSSRRAFPWWISALALPLLVGDIGDNPPDGTICPEDSGLPIGENRRRCRV